LFRDVHYFSLVLKQEEIIEFIRKELAIVYQKGRIAQLKELIKKQEEVK
jgi:hypothetical protein